MNEEDYKQTMTEQQWVEQEFADDVLDATDDVLDGMTFKAPEKKKVQEWTLITRKELLEKYGSGTMWIFKPIYRLDGTGMTFGEMRVTKINLSHAGNGFTYKHGSDVADLGLFPKHITREMWETLVASGEYVEYNKPQERRRPSANGKKYTANYALEA
jgi:hypothetical protein